MDTEPKEELEDEESEGEEAPNWACDNCGGPMLLMGMLWSTEMAHCRDCGKQDHRQHVRKKTG